MYSRMKVKSGKSDMARFREAVRLEKRCESREEHDGRACKHNTGWIRMKLMQTWWRHVNAWTIMPAGPLLSLSLSSPPLRISFSAIHNHIFPHRVPDWPECAPMRHHSTRWCHSAICLRGCAASCDQCAAAEGSAFSGQAPCSEHPIGPNNRRPMVSLFVTLHVANECKFIIIY